MAGNLSEDYQWLELPSDFFTKNAGVEILQAKAIEILTSIGFKVIPDGETIRCGIPPFRSKKDVSLPVDILEEVLRIYGYDNITPRLPKQTMGPVPTNPALLIEHRMAKLLTTTSNFVEVHTYSWYDDNWMKKIGYSPTSFLMLKNPSASHNSRMRKNLVPNLLEVLSRNTTRCPKVSIFEIGKTCKARKDGATIESSEISAIVYWHAQIDVLPVYRELKGVLEKLGHANGFDFVFSKGSRRNEPWCGEGLFTEVRADGVSVGCIGILPEIIQKEVCPLGKAVWFTLDLTKIITECKVHSISYHSLPSYPGSTHDFSLLWDKSKGYSELVALLDQFEYTYMAARSFVTYFEGKDIPSGLASYTFRYLLQAEDKTLQTNDIEAFRSSFIEFLSEHNVSIR